MIYDVQVPMTLGQEFSGYAVQIEKASRRIRTALPDLEELALGGTALGTGINCHPDFPDAVAAGIEIYRGSYESTSLAAS